MRLYSLLHYELEVVSRTAKVLVLEVAFCYTYGVLDEKKLSQDALRVLSYFHEYLKSSHYEWELSRSLEISSGTTVRWLLWLENAGWLRSEFQKGPRQTHRPKCYYRLTSKGFEGSRRLLKDVAELDTVKRRAAALVGDVL